MNDMLSMYAAQSIGQWQPATGLAPRTELIRTPDLGEARRAARLWSKHEQGSAEVIRLADRVVYATYLNGVLTMEV